jgi:subtilisin family serine protease
MAPQQPVERRSRKRPPLARPAFAIASNPDDVAADTEQVNPRQGTALLRKLARTLASAAVLAAPIVFAGPAAAETASPSPAAQIAHAEFLPYMDPPPGEPATVCLVDTGVDINPDTQSTVVEREALDGGDPGDVWDRKHGTEMAMAMGAPINGWGTVGAWPLVRIVSVRAMAPGATAFPFSYYSHGIEACLKHHAVRVINLSFSGPPPTNTEISEIEEYAERARRAGVSVVAGAGNHAGAVEWPAADPAILAVGAAGADKSLCAFSARGSDVQLAGPGCGLELADPDSGAPVSYAGTSPAAAFTSAVLAALRSYRPDLASDSAERLVRNTSLGGIVDVEAAFRAAGLGNAVDHALQLTPPRIVEGPASVDDHPTVEPTSTESVVWPGPIFPLRKAIAATRLPRPRAAIQGCSRHALTLLFFNRPRDTRVLLRGFRRRGEFGARLVSGVTISTSRLRLRPSFDYLVVRYVGDHQNSAPLRLKGCGRAPH